MISLAPHLTELVYTAGAGDTLVGVVAWSDWPAAARELPRIGDAYRFDLETILGLDADLALAWRGGTPTAIVERMEALGLEVMWVETRSLADIASALEAIGNRLGSAETARTVAADYLERLESLRQSNDDLRSDVSVFYQVSAQPLFTLGGRHVITEVFETCGARNVFADLDTEAAAVDREAVVARAPDLIIAGRNDTGTDPLETWRDSLLSQGGATRLESVDAERLVRPTPRIIEGIEFVCDLVEETSTGG